MTTRMMQKVLQLSFSNQLVQIIPEVLATLRGMSVVLVVLAIKVQVSLRGLSHHLIRPSKVQLVLDFFQHLMHWLLEYNPDIMRIGCLRLPCEISTGAIVGISIQPEIPPLLRDNILFSLALQLVFLYSLILIDPIHQLAHIGGRLASQRLPQAMLGWEDALEGVDGDIVKVAIHLIIHLPISARVSLQRLSFMHGQRQQCTQGLRSFSVCNEARAKGLC